MDITLDKPEEPGKKYALAFTILVHVALLAFLFFGVQWKRSKPEVMEVELWSPRPMPAQVVHPPARPPEPEVKPEPKPKPQPKVEPKPEPVVKKPEIVVKEEKKKPEPPKPEAKKPEPPKFDFSKELSRETADLKPRPNTQQLANAAAAESEQRASSNKRGLADYATKIRVKVRGNIMLPPSIQGNPEAVFEVSQLPNGDVLDVKLKRSSNNLALDSAIERAIRKSSPLPKPDDPSLFQRTLEIKYKPFEE
ncbi:energy transducer TonB [Dechloromonas sp. HYN0024]|uniref:energy transducer TonB n=1 Tax=Dechloromonas sp. HYN0024 TaxID=2231055 RepID=UPI001F0734C8|nr:energy transducer TonB [Dechloromonas sp. HYN0024]